MGTAYKADVEQVDADTPRLADGLFVPAPADVVEWVCAGF
jgi:hypothetical protein